MRERKWSLGNEINPESTSPPLTSLGTLSFCLLWYHSPLLWLCSVTLLARSILLRSHQVFFFPQLFFSSCSILLDLQGDQDHYLNISVLLNTEQVLRNICGMTEFLNPWVHQDSYHVVQNIPDLGRWNFSSFCILAIDRKSQTPIFLHWKKVI